MGRPAARRHAARGLLALLVLSGSITPAEAQLSPGKLHEAHESLEGLFECTSCHSIGEKVPPSKCLDCHSILAARIADGRGLHARPEYAECTDCHLDHNGRDFELIHWDPDMASFDHAVTGYALEASHAGLECRRCHAARNIAEPVPLLRAHKRLDRTFLGLTTDCAACHADPHAGQLADRACRSCHDVTTWSAAAGFDHGQARFHLTGKHVGVACLSCHPASSPASEPRVFRGLEFGDCVSCHADPHAGRFPEACSSCHATTGWTSTTPFDHRLTAYPLEGRHARVSCSGCHGGGRARPAFAACRDCHADSHRGEFGAAGPGAACERCHDVNGFVPTRFGVAEHARTELPLDGAHLAVPCVSCHPPAGGTAARVVDTTSRRGSGASTTEVRFAFGAEGCDACHASPHRSGVAAAGACASCHTTAHWRMTAFDHSTTTFPLVGRHATTPCSGCHAREESGEIRLGGLSTRCESCHADVHVGQFAKERRSDGRGGERMTACERCHTPASWAADGFDHGNQVRFALDGAHARLACATCHRPERASGKDVIRYRPLPITCEGCHGPEAKP